MLKARAAESLRELAELLDIPVVTTLMARGAFPDDHPLCLGMPGMHGNYTAVTAMQRSDLLIALGSRFDDRVTGKVAEFAPLAKVIHVDIDPAELGKVRRRRADRRRLPAGDRGDLVPTCSRTCWVAPTSHRHHGVALDPVGMAGEVPAHLRASPSRGSCSSRSTCSSSCATCARGHDRRVAAWASTRCGPASTGRSTTPTPGSTPGASARWASRSRPRSAPRSACPDRTVWAVDGDGCFQMTAQELVTAAVERIPVKVAILNNAYLGMVRQWQEMFYEERYSEVYLSPDLPDYVKWAEAMGCVAFRVESPEEVAADDRVRPTRSTTARSSSSSAPTARRRCSRWCLPA
jgi:acetolactate synthase-1/2/3 large subunit